MPGPGAVQQARRVGANAGIHPMKEIHMSAPTLATTIELPDLDFDGLEVMSVREAVAVPETGATSGSSSCSSTSCCGSSSCCSSGSCG